MDVCRTGYVKALFQSAHECSMRALSTPACRMLAARWGELTEMLQHLILVTALPHDSAVFRAENLAWSQVHGALVYRIWIQDPALGVPRD